LVRLWVTNAGKALRALVEAEPRAIEEMVTADLNKSERRHLVTALEKVRRSAIAAVEDSR
jgi:DNA-binding MarR family transcriptional regulator